MPIDLTRRGLRQPGNIALLAATVLAGGLLSALLGDWTADRLIQQRTRSTINDAGVLTQRLADGITSEIDLNLRYLRGVPVMLSRLAAVKGPLRQLPAAVTQASPGNRMDLPEQRRQAIAGSAPLQDLNGLLDGASQDLGIALILVLDSHGICVASSNFRGATPVQGLDLSDRLYFNGAATGQPSDDYAVGRATGQAGLFFSAPVVDQQHIAGAVAIKINIDEMMHWVSDGNSFVTDRNGVVILAHDRQFLLHALPGAPVLALSPERQRDIYKRSHFEVLERIPFTMFGLHGLETLSGLPDPVVVRAKATLEGGFTVYAVTPLAELGRIRQERQRYFWLAFLTYLGFGMASLSSVAYYVRKRRHLQEVMQLNVSLRGLNRDLEHEVQHDPLTRVYNRGYFVKLLDDAIRAASSRSRFCVAVIDLDFFKTINDSYGHAAGDQALLAFVEIGRRSLRTADQFARIGGEEFAVLLPATDEASATLVLQRLREQLEQTPVSFQQHSFHFTCSVGVTAFRPPDQVDGLLQRADKALYHAKSHGRNQVVRYSEMTPRPTPLAGKLG